jgi:hypothetical protein
MSRIAGRLSASQIEVPQLTHVASISVNTHRYSVSVRLRCYGDVEEMFLWVNSKPVGVEEKKRNA